MFNTLESAFANQPAADPLVDWFDQGPELAEQHRQAMNAWRVKQFEKVDRSLLDPETFFAEHPVPDFHPDKQLARQAVAVRSYLTIANDGRPVTGDLYPSHLRDQIARERFDGRGVGSDQAFHAEIQKEAIQRKDSLAFMQDVSRSAASSALMAAGGEQATDYPAWIAEARTRPGYRADLEPAYLEEWHQRRRQLTEEMEPVREIIAAQWAAMKAGKTADLQGLDDLMADEAGRETLLFAIGGLVKALPKEQQPSVLANLRKQFLGRDLPRELSGLRRSLGQLWEDDAPLPPEYLGQLEPGMDPDAFMRDQRAALEKDTRARERFVRKLESIVNDEYDPIVTVAREGSRWADFEKGLYASPGVALTTVTALLPGVGTHAMYEVLKKDSADMARQSLIQGGMDEDAADQAAASIGTYSAFIQVPMERLGISALTQRLPFVNKAIDRLTTNLATRYAARAASGTATEFVTEMGQDLVPGIVQDFAAAAAKDIPETQWTGEGGVFHEYDRQSIEVLGAILPFSLVMAGGGVFRDRRIRAFAETPDIVKRAAGLSEEAIAAVNAANGIGQQERALQEAWEARDMDSPAALAAQAELTNTVQADQDAAAAATDNGIIPRAVRASDGTWTLYDTATGEEVGKAPNWQGAARLAATHANFAADQDADRIATVVSAYQAAEASGEWSAATGRQTVTELDLGRTLTAEQAAAESDSARARVAAQEKLMGGDGSVVRQVFGQSRTELAQGQLRTVNRLLGGSSVLDVFHEETHGFRRAAHAARILTPADDLAFLRAVDSVLQGTTREGERLAILPADFDQLSPADQETAIDEGISKVMESEVIRTRKGGGKRALPAGIVSKNLAALARLMGDATLGKFRAFIHAIREFFGLALDRAAHIQRGLADGTLDRETYDGYLAKLLGLDEQLDYDQMAREAEAEILDGLMTPEELAAGDPFSLGRGIDPNQPGGANIGDAASPSSVVTPEMDAAYLTAVESENYWQAARILNDAARAAGAVLDERWDNEIAKTWFHGSPSLDIEGGVIDLDRAGSSGHSSEQVFFLTDRAAEAAHYAVSDWTQFENLYNETNFGTHSEDGYIATEGPFLGDDGGRIFTFFVIPKNLARINGQATGEGFFGSGKVYWEVNAAAESLAKDGHDVVILDNVDVTSGGYSSNHALIASPNALVSAELILRDASGNVIPLSQRFNPSSPAASGESSLSLGSARLGVLTGDAIRRIKDPLRRAQAMARVSRKLEDLRLEAERLELIAGSKRLKRSLAKEAAMRQALRQQELENEAWARHSAILTDDDLTKIKSQPGHAFLSDPDSPLRGRLMSKTKAIKEHPDLFHLHSAAEYEGSENISRALFGGTLRPDQAAQEMFEAGLIREPSPEAMWTLLESEGRHVASMKRVLDAAKADLREARTVAKAETNAWLATQADTQATTYSPRQEILRSLAALDAILSSVPAEIRGKVGGYVQAARIADPDSGLEFLRERLARVDSEMEKWLKRQYDIEFRQLLIRARPEKDEAGKRPRGKIGADVHQLFADLYDAMPMTAAETEAEALRLETLAEQEDLTPEQQSHATLQAHLVRLVGDWSKATAARREAAVLEATRVFEAGYLAHRIQLSRQREDRSKKRSILARATGKGGSREERRARARKDDATRTGRVLKAGLSLFSFEQIVQKSFGEGTAEANALVDWERRAAHAKADAVQNKLDQLDDLFATLAGGKFAGEQMRYQMADDKSITATDSRGVVHTFSQLEAITATLMWRQEDGQRHMIGHLDDMGNPVGEWNYDQGFIDQLEDALTDNAKAVRLHLSEQYAAEYDRLNSVFRQLYGVSMPRHSFYSPLTVKPAQAGAGQTLDPITGSTMASGGLTPGSLKTRSQSAIAEPDFRDSLQTYIAHAKSMEHWMAYAPFTTEAMALINAREVGNAVEAGAGKEAVSTLRGWLDYFAQGGTRDAAAHLASNQLINRMMGRAAAVALVGRISVLAIQATQLGAALAEMPARAYLARLARLFAGRLDWTGAMRNDYIQRRMQQMPPVVQQALEGLSSSKPNRLKFAVRKLGETIAGADALFTAGTYAIAYDYHLSEGRKMGIADPAAYARQAAERSTDRVAQPTRPGTRSFFEVTGTNPAVRLMWAFASEPRQKLMLTAYALGSGKSAGTKARALAVTWVAGGLVAAVIRATMRDIRNSDDDEWFDEDNWDPKRLALASLTGPFAGIPFLGDTLEGAVFEMANEYMPEGNLLSSIPRAADRAFDLLSGDTPEDFEEAVKDAETILSGAGLASESAAAAASLSHLVRDLLSIIENATGD